MPYQLDIHTSMEVCDHGPLELPQLIVAAYCYGNENEVGEGLKEAFDSGVKREDIFVTTKLWCTYHSRVEENLDKSLKSLGLDYVDLYLMHWPVAMNPNGQDPTLLLHSFCTPHALTINHQETTRDSQSCPMDRAI
jgi:diketogulonate reductase-like aldo/keto reductase